MERRDRKSLPTQPAAPGGGTLLIEGSNQAPFVPAPLNNKLVTADDQRRPNGVTGESDEKTAQKEHTAIREAFFTTIESTERPVVTTAEILQHFDGTANVLWNGLDELETADEISRLELNQDTTVWFPTAYEQTASRERMTVFPARREIVIDRPSQFTRARLSQFARLSDTNRHDGYIYQITEQDIWNAPFETRDGLLRSVRSTLGREYPNLEEWIRTQWERAHKFRLATHPEGYVILEAGSADLLGNIAEQHLTDDTIRARIDDTTAWVNADRTAEIKRTLYEAGYPVQDDRELDRGDRLAVDLTVELRPYQRDWVNRFQSQGSGILVGPPGSGKTIASLGILAEIGGETLILVPSRELASQWRASIRQHTSIRNEQIGEYHGGKKEIRPITIATYQTAGMDRHRSLFDSRQWGLIIYDECQHLPAPVSRRSASLQTKHRLGVTATPVRDDDKEEEIFTMIGQPIGTDWETLFDAGYVAEPTVEIRYIPWDSETNRNEYGASQGHEKRQLAAMNPAKINEIEAILAAIGDEKVLIFVEYIQQGQDIATALDVPFVSGETPHAKRSKYYDAYRRGEITTLVVSRVGDEGIDLPDAEIGISASGLGGSRRQGAQRAGRTMRPFGNAKMYVLATRGTREEDFARARTRHLAARGVRVREQEPVAFEEESPDTLYLNLSSEKTEE